MRLFFWKITRKAVRVILILLFKLDIRGEEHLSGLEPPVLIVSNHIWRIDPFVIIASLPFSRFPKIRFVAYYRFLQVPILGALLRFYGAVPVRNGIGIEKTLSQPKRLLEEGEVVGIFPEGKMSRAERPTHCRPGASYLARTTGVKILPIKLSGTHLSLKKTIMLKQSITVVFGEPFILEDKNDLAGAATIMRKMRGVT